MRISGGLRFDGKGRAWVQAIRFEGWDKDV